MFFNIIRLRKAFKYSNNALEKRKESKSFKY